MASGVETNEIRGLDIDKAVKGFALREYNFLEECLVSAMSGDSLRWYQETASDLTATTPTDLNVSPLSSFPYLEVTWTRQTSYVQKYAAEGFISLEDAKSADIDVVTRTLLRLTRAVIKKRDIAIYSVFQGASNSFAVTSIGGATWDAVSGQDPIKDLLHAQYLISSQDYDARGASLLLNPYDYKSLITWLISSKGTYFTGFSSDTLQSGRVLEILGLRIKVSNNVTAGEAIVIVPQRAVTWKEFTPITARTIEEVGIGYKIRVWCLGVAIMTDPYAACRLTNLKT